MNKAMNTTKCACGRATGDCDGSRRGCIERALADGRLRVEVDDPRPYNGRVHFAGDHDVSADESIRVVHLMSRPAGGEIRGYVLVESDRSLHLRTGTSCQMRWPAADAAVAGLLHASRVVGEVQS